MGGECVVVEQVSTVIGIVGLMFGMSCLWLVFFFFFWWEVGSENCGWEVGD
jgi:hypothetical protein